MNWYRTTVDPAKRAADIANNEAEKVWRDTGDHDLWSATLSETYRAALREFHYLLEEVVHYRPTR